MKKKKIIIAFPTPVISELLMGPVKSVSDDILGKNIKKLSKDKFILFINYKYILFMVLLLSSNKSSLPSS